MQNLKKEEIKGYLSLFSQDELYDLIIKDNKSLKELKYEEYKKNQTPLSITELKEILSWEECYLDKNKEISNEIYINQMKKILSKLNINIEYCDLRIFKEDETFEKVKSLIKTECHNTKCQIIKIIKIYLKNFIPKTGIKLPNHIYYLYEYYYEELSKKENITKETEKIIKFKELLELMWAILEEKIELTPEQKTYNNIIKIICLIYSYGYKDEGPKIGVLRYSDMMNTIILKEERETELNYISYIEKKWYFRANYTKNKKDRSIDLTEDFLIKLDNYRSKTKNDYLFMYNYKHVKSLIKIISIYNLPKLNDMRKSAEQYSYENFSSVEGGIYAKNNGHITKTIMKSYINLKKTDKEEIKTD
jgi:hypothetical protein